MRHPVGKRLLGARPLFQVRLQRQHLTAGLIQRRRQLMHPGRTIDEQQSRAFRSRLLRGLSANALAAPVMATTLSLKRILPPYAAALWLAINFSYQKPAGVIPRSRSAVATALTIGGGPQR